jgi:Flp pilus assembly pilin Flp
MLEYVRQWSLAATMAAFSLRERTRREEGQALVEYALILFLIAVVCITVLTALGTGVRDTLQSIVDAI